MEPAATALMVLLSCSPEAANCREMRATETYSSMQDCRERLPAVLERLNRADRTVIGHCSLAADAPPTIDRLATGSIAPEDRVAATVYVTRFVEGRPVTQAYDVQGSP